MFTLDRSTARNEQLVLYSCFEGDRTSFLPRFQSGSCLSLLYLSVRPSVRRGPFADANDNSPLQIHPLQSVVSLSSSSKTTDERCIATGSAAGGRAKPAG